MRAENPEVYYSTAPMVVATASDIAALKRIAEANPRLRSRLCAHPSPSADLHEMLIVHHRDVYVRPHMHIGKPESLHVIEGTALAVVLGDDGSIEDVLEMGAAGSGRPFYYRMPERVFHTLIITSEWLVFLETTAGPFDPARTRFPDWAPDGSVSAAARRYRDSVAEAARAFVERKRKREV
jgi:cupin fold WbuC family metalloprotein